MPTDKFKSAEKMRSVLGLSYRDLAELTTYSHTVIHKVLTVRESAFPLNRERILADVRTAMRKRKLVLNKERRAV